MPEMGNSFFYMSVGVKKMARQIALWISMLVFIVSFYMVGNYIYSYVENANALAEIQEVYEAPVQQQATTSATQLINEPIIRPQIAKLQQINKEIVGWISIDDTKLNNPILQADDNDFYLTHNYKGQQSRAGSIFMDYRNDVALEDQHTILYGHVMRDDRMFGALSNYADEAYAKEHQVIHVETMHGAYELHVFAAYETTTRFYYLDTTFEGKEYGEFLQDIKGRSRIDTGVTMTVADNMVTLSTCTLSEDDDERFVVHAKVIPVK